MQILGGHWNIATSVPRLVGGVCPLELGIFLGSRSGALHILPSAVSEVCFCLPSAVFEICSCLLFICAFSILSVVF